MKRTGDSLPSQPKRVKTRTSLPTETLQTPVWLVGSDAAVQELAKPYLLATAKIPIHCFSFHWGLGNNRVINQKQVENLRDIFSTQSLDREYADHHVRGLCSRADIERITAQLSRGGDLEGSSKWPSFHDWMAVNGIQIELMAGQHRIEALREYVRCSSLSSDELWWICDLYDKDTLPPEVNIRLRANRADPTLPDSHGQIWNELATLASTDKKIFKGSNAAIEKEMLQRLRLSNGAKFPIRRLVTLWKNVKWEKMITAWCCTPLGQATFNISTWDEMARCRIDNFWFNVLGNILKIISEISVNDPTRVSASDWITLTQLSQNDSSCSINDIFYPSPLNDDYLDSDTLPRPRAPRFLTALTDDEYSHAYQYVSRVERREFVNIHSILKAVKREGKTISSVMLHVVWWLNPNPTLPKDRESNKPSLRLDFLPTLTAHYNDRDTAEKVSIKLESDIVLFARSRYADLTSYSCQPYLSQYPNLDSGDDGSYRKRFAYQVWKDLLQLVQTVAGPQLQCPAIPQFSSEDAQSVSSEALCTITQAMCSVLPQVAEFSKNPALSNSEAVRALRAEIQQTVAAWAVRQCEISLQPKLQAEVENWPVPSIEVVQSEHERFDQLYQGPNRLEAPTQPLPVGSIESESTTPSPAPTPTPTDLHTKAQEPNNKSGESQPDILPTPIPLLVNNGKSPLPLPPPAPATSPSRQRKEHSQHPSQGEEQGQSTLGNDAVYLRRILLPRPVASWRRGQVARSNIV